VSFVLDCSATLPWIFGDEATDATDQPLDTLHKGAQAWVPALWHLELANVLIGAQRRGRIDQAGIEAFLSHLANYAIMVDGETIPRAWTKTLDLAVLHGLSAHDAACLELALRRDLPLATKDKALIDASRQAGIRLALESAQISQWWSLRSLR
jgi:predicted nucleic acid-binding protein